MLDFRDATLGIAKSDLTSKVVTPRRLACGDSGGLRRRRLQAVVAAFPHPLSILLHASLPLRPPLLVFFSSSSISSWLQLDPRSLQQIDAPPGWIWPSQCRRLRWGSDALCSASGLRGREEGGGGALRFRPGLLPRCYPVDGWCSGRRVQLHLGRFRCSRDCPRSMAAPSGRPSCPRPGFLPPTLRGGSGG